VGETHGKMKDDQTALKGLNINVLKVQPFQGCDFDFIIFHPDSRDGYSNLIPSGICVNLIFLFI
jgi:hypothetical protein